MNYQDRSNWPAWAGRITAANLFIAMIAARDLSALQVWRIAFWPSAAISALIAIVIGFLVTIACKQLEVARLIHHGKAKEYKTRPEEREYIRKIATDLSQVMQRPFEPGDPKNGKKGATVR